MLDFFKLRPIITSTNEAKAMRPGMQVSTKLLLALREAGFFILILNRPGLRVVTTVVGTAVSISTMASALGASVVGALVAGVVGAFGASVVGRLNLNLNTEGLPVVRVALDTRGGLNVGETVEEGLKRPK